MHRCAFWCALAAFCLFVAGCAPAGREAAFTVILEGDSADAFPRQQGRVIASLADWEDLQQQLQSDILGQAQLPNVDFSKSMLVAAFAGERPSGGYAISVRRIVETGEALVVEVTEVKPASDQMAIAQVTYPYQIVSLSRTVLPVRFRFEQP
jgi:hypothetical protein